MSIETPPIDILAVLPEVILVAGGLLIMLLGASFPAMGNMLAPASFAVVAGSGASTLLLIGEDRLAFSGAIAVDGFAVFFRLLLALAAALTIMVSQDFVHYEDVPRPEFYALLLFSTAGMMLMAAAADLLVMFLALETLSLPLYVLAASRRRRTESQEGAMKYFLLGAFSSAFFLYGVAAIYGATSSTRLFDIATAAASSTLLDQGLLLGGLGLALVGFGFKVGAVPFHMWTPDVYQGAPSPVTGFMAAGSKAAGFAAMLRVLVGGFATLEWDWAPAVGVLAVLSMIGGSVVAVVQSDVKRMLAYSSIAHAGYILLAVMASGGKGTASALFYLVVYTVSTIGAFAVVYSVARPGESSTELSDYAGLATRRPWLALSFSVLLFSLAGVPPFGGFFAKLQVFSAAVAAGHEYLVVVGVLTSAVAAFFYVRVVVLMYMQEAKQPSTQLLVSPGTDGALALCLLLIVGLGVLPTPLLNAARSATLLFR